MTSIYSTGHQGNRHQGWIRLPPIRAKPSTVAPTYSWSRTRADENAGEWRRTLPLTRTARARLLAQLLHAALGVGTAACTIHELLRVLGGTEHEPCPLSHLRVHLHLDLARAPTRRGRRDHRGDGQDNEQRSQHGHHTSGKRDTSSGSRVPLVPVGQPGLANRD